MNKNSKSNKKHTWIALVAIALLRFLCSSPPKILQCMLLPKKNLLSQSRKALLFPSSQKNLLQCVVLPPSFPLSRIYIYITSQILNLLPKGKSPIFSLLFSLSFFQSSNSKAIFPISNSSPKPFKESPTFLKLQW